MIQYTIQVEGMACGMCEAHETMPCAKTSPSKKSHPPTARDRLW